MKRNRKDNEIAVAEHVRGNLECTPIPVGHLGFVHSSQAVLFVFVEDLQETALGQIHSGNLSLHDTVVAAQFFALHRDGATVLVVQLQRQLGRGLLVNDIGENCLRVSNQVLLRQDNLWLMSAPAKTVFTSASSSASYTTKRRC